MDPECAIYESLQVYTRNAGDSYSYNHDLFFKTIPKIENRLSKPYCNLF